MFHRVPSFYFIAVATTALIFLLAALFASSLSSPGTAHASHPDLPEVSIASITPEVGEEGGYLRVTLQLSRALTADEKFCYPGRTADEEPRDEMCIQGGIIAWDSYNDHLQDGNSGNADGLVKFVFGEGGRDGVPQEDGSILKRWTVSISNDNCITPDRTIRIAVNTVFDDADTYGYLIDGTVHTVPIAGNDEENGVLVADGGDCLPVDDGVTEDITVNHAPAFSSRPITLSVPENTEAGEDIGNPVTATDEDNDDLTYLLTGADATHFDIDSSTGQIETLGDLDHETKSTYHLAVSVTDNKDIYGDPDSAEDDSIDVTINVDDVNEPPVFDSTAPTNLNVVENTAANENIGSPVTATDPDNTIANPTKDTLTYSLDTGDGASFDIDADGQIKTKAALNRETKASYTVTVSVTDSKDATGASGTAVDDTREVTITVGNEVEPPTFTDGDAGTTRAIAENTPAGRPVGDPVAATSEDGVTLTYSLDDQDGASFDIDSDGQIKTKADLDYEDRSSYSVTVSVTDGLAANGNTEGTPTEDASIDVTINVTDINEKPQFADDAPTTQNVDENTPAGTNIGSAYTATDPDAGDTLTYSLDEGDGAAFDIDANGQIKTKADLNYEADPSYTVIVQVTDSRDDSGTIEQTPVADDTHTVTITIDNEVEPPTFDEEIPQGQASLSRSIPENTTAGRPIGDPVSATSEDGATLIYSLEGTDAASFDFDTGTGQIKTRDALDYEDTNSYSVTVSITDGKDVHGNTESPAVEDDSIAVTINVTDVNEKPVFADDAPISQTVAENTAADTNIGSAYTATDPENDALTYTLDSGSAATFEIDANGQLKTKADLNYEADASYTVIVQVTDSKDDNGVAEDTPTIDATHAVTITVTDQDDDGSITLSSDPPSAGTTVTATLEDQDGVKAGVAVTWLWETSSDRTNWNTITDATTDSYTPGTDDVGDYLRVTATYEDELGAGKTAQTESGAILTAPATNTDSSFADLNTTRSVPKTPPQASPSVRRWLPLTLTMKTR